MSSHDTFDDSAIGSSPNKDTSGELHFPENFEETRNGMLYLDKVQSLDDESHSLLMLLEQNRKEFNDNVHGIMRVHKLAQVIISTDEIQRLRNIKQLGVADTVFPTATSSRLIHSLGVMHLARVVLITLIQKLDLRQYNLDLKDILCVELAGLLHDCGHGPFSHMFEEYLARANCGASYRHEEMSLEVIDSVFAQEDVKKSCREFNMQDIDVTFIKELVYGPLLENGGKYIGRPAEKNFLYRIINNKKNGIDVDKIDYLIRDSHSTGVGKEDAAILKMVIAGMTVTYEDGTTELAFNMWAFDGLKALVEKRMELHLRVYQHPKVMMYNEMTLDLLLMAGMFLHFPTRTGELIPLPSITKSTHAFLLSYDEDLMRSIRQSRDERLEPARNLLKRIQKRDCYSIIASMSIDESVSYTDFLFYVASTKELFNIRDLHACVITINSGLVNNSWTNVTIIDSQGRKTNLSETIERKRKVVFFTKTSQAEGAMPDPAVLLALQSVAAKVEHGGALSWGSQVWDWD